MRTFLKWTAIGFGAVGAAAVAYWKLRGLRGRLDSGLRRAERVTRDAHQAVAQTDEALGQPHRSIGDVREVVSY